MTTERGETLRTLTRDAARRSFLLFPEDFPLGVRGTSSDDVDEVSRMTKLRAKFNLTYRSANNYIGALKATEKEKNNRTNRDEDGATLGEKNRSKPTGDEPPPKKMRDEEEKDVTIPASVVLDQDTSRDLEREIVISKTPTVTNNSNALITVNDTKQNQIVQVKKRIKKENPGVTNALALARDRPEWHAPWKLYRVLMGHLGWVRSVAVDPANEWFCTGAADRTIKIWDLASGKLKLTLTGHIGAVRGLCVSDRHPYMFSAGDDKQVKCWDLEYNKVIRSYHGHLSGVHACALHPSLDILVTGGRDATVRVWDMRTKAQIFGLGGHRDAVNTLQTQKVDPQIISGSSDSTVRLWDLAAGRCMSTLTNHKKGVRAVSVNPREFSFASASADNIKTWQLPRGDFMRNLSGHNVIINSLSINQDGVLVSGGNDGSLAFWDYGSAHEFYRTQTQVQPGSLDCEAGIFASTFDVTGTRLITAETDKTVKMWKEDEKATPETHPLQWTPNMLPKRY